jgi:hypothetical protein
MECGAFSADVRVGRARARRYDFHSNRPLLAQKENEHTRETSTRARLKPAGLKSRLACVWTGQRAREASSRYGAVAPNYETVGESNTCLFAYVTRWIAGSTTWMMVSGIV